MGNNEEKEKICEWKCVSNKDSKFTPGCLNENATSFINIKKLSKRTGIPIGNLLKECIYCGEKIKVIF